MATFKLQLLRTLATIFLLLLFHFEQGTSDCTFRTTSGMGRNSPLLLRPEKTEGGDRFIFPKRQTDILLFQHHQKVLLACPGNKNTVVIEEKPQPFTEITATCVENNSFLINGTSTHFRNIKCAKTPDSSILTSKEDCSIGSKRYKRLYIGFQLPVTREFIKTIELCYDPAHHTTLYTKFKVTKGIKNGQNIPRSGYFKTEIFRNNLRTNFASIYSYKGQEARFQALLGREYIKCHGEGKHEDATCLQKGHLAAFAHFPYYSQQEATMYAINTVPQWSKINMGNWKKLEDRIRSYASETDQDLHVYVGAYRVLKLQNSNKKNIEIFLSTSGKTSIVPVPEIIYTIVYDQNMNHGIVFLVVNDTKKSNLRKICRDSWNSHTSLVKNWADRTDVSKGYLYCCTISDFLQKTGLDFPDKPLLV